MDDFEKEALNKLIDTLYMLIGRSDANAYYSKQASTFWEVKKIKESKQQQESKNKTKNRS